jgi:hypothetical protein
VPRFHFKTVHGTESHDDPEGMELKDLRAAWKEATKATGEILKQIDGSLEPEREWRMDVHERRRTGHFQFTPDTRNLR